MTVNRSPRHPSMALGEALERLAELYRAIHDHAVSQDSAIGAWGLSSTGSTGKRTLAALVHFGLAEYVGSGKQRNVKITDRGKDIATDPERVTSASERAIREAALNPAIFKQVWERWGPVLPPDNRPIEVYLVRELGFNENTTGDFLRDFRATIGHAGLDSTASTEHISYDQADSPQERGDPPGDPGKKNPLDADPNREVKGKGKPAMESNVRSEVREITVPLRGGAMVVMSMAIPMPKSHYRSLKKWLEWAEDEITFEEGEGEGQPGAAEA